MTIIYLHKNVERNISFVSNKINSINTNIMRNVSKKFGNISCVSKLSRRDIMFVHSALRGRNLNSKLKVLCASIKIIITSVDGILRMYYTSE